VRDAEDKALKDAKAAYDKFVKELEKVNTDNANCDKKCTKYTDK
jgi:hypothetical protein